MGSNRRSGSSPADVPNDWDRASPRREGPREGPFRAHARRDVRLESVFAHARGGWRQAAGVENIGLGGARVAIHHALAEGDDVSLSLMVPTQWDPLVLHGRVAWVSIVPTTATGSRKAGVAFEYVAADTVFVLYELLFTLDSDF